MSANAKDEGARLAAIMNTLAEAAITATDQELLDDAAAAGVDIKKEGARVRCLLSDAVQSEKARVRSDLDLFDVEEEKT